MRTSQVTVCDLIDTITTQPNDVMLMHELQTKIIIKLENIFNSKMVTITVNKCMRFTEKAYTFQKPNIMNGARLLVVVNVIEAIQEHRQ